MLKFEVESGKFYSPRCFRSATDVWHSKTKGDVRISEMHSLHLANAISFVEDEVEREREYVAERWANLNRLIAGLNTQELAKIFCPQYDLLIAEALRRKTPLVDPEDIRAMVEGVLDRMVQKEEKVEAPKVTPVAQSSDPLHSVGELFTNVTTDVDVNVIILVLEGEGCYSFGDLASKPLSFYLTLDLLSAEIVALLAALSINPMIKAGIVNASQNGTPDVKYMTLAKYHTALISVGQDLVDTESTLDAWLDDVTAYFGDGFIYDEGVDQFHNLADILLEQYREDAEHVSVIGFKEFESIEQGRRLSYLKNIVGMTTLPEI